MLHPHLTTLATHLENTRTTAMVNADVSTLSELLSDDLYYGHTADYIDTKVSFI